MKGAYTEDHYAMDDAADGWHGSAGFANDGFELVFV